MARWCSAVLIVMVVLMCGTTGGAQALDPNDNFDDGVINTAQWQPYAEPGASIEETGGRIVMSLPPSDWGEINLTSTWRLRGPFDIQVDYQLLQWPVSNGGRVGLLAMFPNDWEWEWVQRTSGVNPLPEGDELYLANVRSDHGCPCEGRTATSDTAGRLRLTRDANLTMTFWYWSNEASDWVAIYQRAVPADDMQIRLTCWGPVTAAQGVVVAFDNFRVNRGEVISIAPTIGDVVIDRGRDTDWWDWARYHQRVTVQVKGSEYEQPACVIIDDPDGSQFVISTCSPGGWYDWFVPNYGGFALTQLTIGPDYTYTYTWYEGRKPQPLLPGSYQIRVVGNNGSEPTLTTPAAPEVPEEGPVLTGPPADGVIDTVLPIFEWLSLPGEDNWLQLRAEGATNYSGPAADADDAGEIWRADVDQMLAAVYNFYGSGPDLEPGRTYYWQVNSWSPVDDRVSDARVSIWNEQTASHRFAIDTEWPALPDLPGRLVYTQTQYGDWSQDFDVPNVMQYGTTIGTRKWIGPAASESPDLSWDGSKLEYRICDTGTWIDSLDGSMPTRVPDNDSWAYSSFSPDATRILYAEATAPNWTLDAWTQKVDGSDKRLLVAARGLRISRPHWSPDGAWIAYTTCCDPSGYNVWLIRPDGTQDHPVIPTTVAGYPDWTITWFANGAFWSPDARRLVATFVAVSPDGSEYINALGTISREGGEVTPMWVNPPGAICCAAAFPYAWSPDGSAIVFASGFDLTPDPEWANGKFEPGVELWMKNADGSGEPTRLTYDYSYTEGAAWWAPNTPAGNNVVIAKGDATLTFANVTAEGSTLLCVTDELPAPAPAGYTFAADVWKGATTAQFRGALKLSLHYPGSLAGQAGALRLLQWNGSAWKDITSDIDETNRLLQGQCKTLTTFAIAIKGRPGS